MNFQNETWFEVTDYIVSTGDSYTVIWQEKQYQLRNVNVCKIQNFFESAACKYKRLFSKKNGQFFIEDRLNYLTSASPFNPKTVKLSSPF